MKPKPGGVLELEQAEPSVKAHAEPHSKVISACPTSHVAACVSAGVCPGTKLTSYVPQPASLPRVCASSQPAGRPMPLVSSQTSQAQSMTSGKQAREQLSSSRKGMIKRYGSPQHSCSWERTACASVHALRDAPCILLSLGIVAGGEVTYRWK